MGGEEEREKGEKERGGKKQSKGERLRGMKGETESTHKHTAEVSVDTEYSSTSCPNCCSEWKNEPQGQRPDVSDSKGDKRQPRCLRKSPNQMGHGKFLLRLPTLSHLIAVLMT